MDPEPTNRHGRKREWIINGIAVLCFIVVMTLILGPILLHGPCGPRVSCMNNLKTIGNCLTMYMSDWDGTLPVLSTKSQRAPSGKGWPAALCPYTRFTERENIRIFCSCIPDGVKHRVDRMTYSFNRRLSGFRYADLHADLAGIALVFDSANDDPRNNNLNGDATSHPSASNPPVVGSYVKWPRHGRWYFRNWPDWTRPRHVGRTPVLCADGHVTRDHQPSFSPK